MTTQEKIHKLKASLDSGAVPENLVPSMKAKLAELEAQLEKEQKGSEAAPAEKPAKTGKKTVKKEKKASKTEKKPAKSAKKSGLGKSVKQTMEEQAEPDCNELIAKEKKKEKAKKERELHPPRKKRVSEDMRDKAISWMRAIKLQVAKKGTKAEQARIIRAISKKMVDLLKTVKKELSGIESDKFITDFEDEVESFISKLEKD